MPRHTLGNLVFHVVQRQATSYLLYQNVGYWIPIPFKFLYSLSRDTLNNHAFFPPKIYWINLCPRKKSYLLNKLDLASLHHVLNNNALFSPKIYNIRFNLRKKIKQILEFFTVPINANFIPLSRYSTEIRASWLISRAAPDSRKRKSGETCALRH